MFMVKGVSVSLHRGLHGPEAVYEALRVLLRQRPTILSHANPNAPTPPRARPKNSTPKGLGYVSSVLKRVTIVRLATAHIEAVLLGS